MKILVCGDRNFTDQDLMDDTLAFFRTDIDEIIEGEARGADTLARIAAEKYSIPVRKFPADWDKYGKGAGPIRNKQMLEEGQPDMVLAFLAKESKGTRNMLQQALEARVRHIHIVNI